MIIDNCNPGHSVVFSHNAPSCHKPVSKSTAGIHAVTISSNICKDDVNPNSRPVQQHSNSPGPNLTYWQTLRNHLTNRKLSVCYKNIFRLFKISSRKQIKTRWPNNHCAFAIFVPLSVIIVILNPFFKKVHSLFLEKRGLFFDSSIIFC